MVNEFLLIFSSIIEENLKLARVVAKIACARSSRSVLSFASSLLSYSLVNNTVCKFWPLMVIILRTE